MIRIIAAAVVRLGGLSLLVGGAPVAAALDAGAGPPAARPAPRAPAPARLPVAFAVAHVDGAPVVDDAWIEAQLTTARGLLEPLGVTVERAPDEPYPPIPAAVETRAQRDVAVRSGVSPVVHVVVVALLRDVDTPPDERRGVHWRVRGEPARRGILLSRIASSLVFTHELGHYLGLGHSQERNNVMSYVHDEGGVPFFTAQQGATLRANALAVLASGEVKPRRSGSP